MPMVASFSSHSFAFPPVSGAWILFSTAQGLKDCMAHARYERISQKAIRSYTLGAGLASCRTTWALSNEVCPNSLNLGKWWADLARRIREDHPVHVPYWTAHRIFVGTLMIRILPLPHLLSISSQKFSNGTRCLWMNLCANKNSNVRPWTLLCYGALCNLLHGSVIRAWEAWPWFIFTFQNWYLSLTTQPTCRPSDQGSPRWPWWIHQSPYCWITHLVLCQLLRIKISDSNTW